MRHEPNARGHFPPPPEFGRLGLRPGCAGSLRNPGADHEKLAVLSTGSSCCTELHDIQMKIATLDAAVIEEERRLQGVTRAA